MLVKVRETICQQELIKPGDGVLLALSGGADSVCLLEVLLELSKEIKFSVFAAHLHHGLRGAEADSDEAFVCKLCHEKNVPLFTRRVDVNALARATGRGLEEAGREARYAFFNEILAQEGLNKIATAHHADDNIETVLMRLLRGTGPLGLAGIPYQNGAVVRPFLDVTRKDIESFLNQRNISFCTDSTNQETTFTRNRIRHELIPFLEQSFNPNFRQNFLSQIKLYASCGAFIEQETESLFSVLSEPVAEGYSFEIKLLKKAADFMQSMLLYRAISALSGEREVGTAAVRAAAALLEKPRGKASLGGGVIGQVCHGKLYIKKESVAKPFSYDVEPTGCFTIPETNVTICFSVVNSVPEQAFKGAVYLDLEKLENKQLRLRSRRPGDYFYPVGMAGKKKVKKFFIDNKIPQFKRDSVPLLTADEDVVWVAGERGDARYVLKDQEKTALCVKFFQGGKN